MKIVIFLFPIILSLLFLSIKLLSPSTYIILIQEDSAIEYVQAFFYFLSSIVSFFISIKLLTNKLTLHGVLYGILAIGLLFISLEEISWGQRIFNITNPDYFALHNVQNELSFHNLDSVHPLLNIIYLLTGAYGSFAWLFVSTLKTKCYPVLNFIVPVWFISSYFFFAFGIYTLFQFIKPYNLSFFIWRDQEPAELLLSMGFLLFVVTNYIKLRILENQRSHP